MINVFLGYDKREKVASDVCAHSIYKHTRRPTTVTEVKSSNMSTYKREWYMKEGIKYDKVDNRPFSTDFAFARFWVPYMMQYKGFAIFMDGDFLIHEDLHNVFSEIDHAHAVSVVKHAPEDHPSTPDMIKMDGQVQTVYPKKNWSSFMVFNCEHAMCKKLTPTMMNNVSGSHLHQFQWIQDDDYIGELKPKWNQLMEATDAPFQHPVAKEGGWHYTLGGPWFEGYEECQGAGDWYREHYEMIRDDAS